MQTARNPASRPVRGSRGRDAGGRRRLEAPGAARDARAPAAAGWSTSTRSSTASGGRSSRPLRGTRSTITSPACAPRSARSRSLGSPDGYALKDARVDAVRFEELLAETRAALRDGDVSAAADAVASALALWRGPALQGLTGTAWFGAEARRLETLRVDALEEHFEVGLALGEHRELAPALRSALADNPFRERLWGQLMLALYRSGRQADALETFQEARRVLADELGLEPGPELRRLQEAILAHDPAIAAVPVARRRRGNLPGAFDVVRRPRGGARARSRALLQEHRLVTLIGPPGVGKSRLAVEAARSLEAEFPDGIWLVDFARAGRRGRRRPAARARPRRPRRRPARARDLAAARRGRARSSSTPASTSSTRRRGSRSTLLADCSRVRILATSREALRVAGEVRLPVAPLAGRGGRALPRARACGAAWVRAGRRGCRRSPRRSRGASTGCRSRSSSPPRA